MKFRVFVDGQRIDVDVPDATIAIATKGKIAGALRHLQLAQDELGRACAYLSPLVGGIGPWKKAHKLHDQVHALWYTVEALGQKSGVRIDDMNIDVIARGLIDIKAQLRESADEEARRRSP